MSQIDPVSALYTTVSRSVKLLLIIEEEENRVHS